MRESRSRLHRSASAEIASIRGLALLAVVLRTRIPQAATVEAIFFFEKKKQKTFVNLAHRKMLAVQEPNQTNKSFLLLFFEKEGLSSFLIPTDCISSRTWQVANRSHHRQTQFYRRLEKGSAARILIPGFRLDASTQTSGFRSLAFYSRRTPSANSALPTI